MLYITFEDGYSAKHLMVDNVTEYKSIGKGMYVITYKDPSKNYELYDIIVKHVEKIEED